MVLHWYAFLFRIARRIRDNRSCHDHIMPWEAPHLTIVTPTLNQAPFIRAAIESVLSQNYPHVEYLIIDGGSDDATPLIAAEYASRLTFVSERDRGQSHAINKGFLRAHGEIVGWLNSDDILLPGALARAADALAEAPSGIGAIYGEGRLMDREGRIKARFPATEPFNLWKLTYLSDYILQQSTLFRRDALADVGWLDETLHYAMDWDILIRLGKRFGLYYTRHEIGALREYAETKTSSGGGARIQEIRRVLQRHTGRRFAPGYWNYYLEMLRARWKTAPLTLPLYYVSAIPLVLIQRYAQGLYSDRWVSDRLKLMAPEIASRIIVRGHLPPSSALSGQRLTLLIDNRCVRMWAISPGAFELRFAKPPESSGALEFEIHASHFQRPHRGREIGLRKIAWRFESLDWE